MKAFLVVLSAALALTTTATSSDAQCNFARPPRTKSRNLELAMVPAHVVCGDIGQVKLWLRDVMNDGIGLANSTGHLCVVSRVTTNDRAYGDQTWVDFPACFPVTLTNGDNTNVGYVTYSFKKMDE